MELATLCPSLLEGGVGEYPQLSGPTMGTQSLRAISRDSTVALPMRVYGPLENGNQAMKYCPFSLANLFKWQTQQSAFSLSRGLINFFEAILFIMEEAKKNAPSDTGAPLIDQAVIDSGLPLTKPDWNVNMAEGKGYLKVYFQTPLLGLKGAAQ